MAEEERHPNKRSTGTVPKQRNNYNRPFNEVERLRSFSNSSSDCYPSRDSSNEVKNPRRSNKIKDLIVESTLENHNFATQIGYSALNSIGSSNPSSPTSQRNASSSTLKCDNITKCPNKKQIEDKLNQIHEYLKVTNSLMASMKKTDDQIAGRIDDFPAENAFTSRKNEENVNLENVGYNLGFLKDCQQMGYPLRRKSENKRCSPGHNQSNLLLEVCNDVHTPSNKDIRNYIEFDTSSKDRSEMKKPIHPHPHIMSNQDKGLPNVDSLHNHIISMHNSHDENERLLETLDGTDSELASEHAELHKKMIELQNRKFQIDRLVAQLQSFGDTYEDTDNQFKKICAMKEQLNKLKDMLEVVKMPDNILQNTNNPFDDRKTSCYLCSSGEQFREKDVKKPKLKSRIHNDSNMFRNANVTSRDSRPKQINTNSRERGNQVNKANMSSIAQKIALQTELECKKRELEEIMGKHKGNASNLNQDIGIDTKSEISSITNGLNDPWTSIISQESDSERFSSDDSPDAANNYSELKHNFLSLPSLNYSPSGLANSQPENSQRGNYVQQSEYQPPNGLPYVSDAHFRSNSVGATSRFKKTRRSNSEELNSNQMQKQLQMIRSMCDTLLEQQVNQENPSNMQQLRNNLISSPQPFPPAPQPQRSNTGNIANPNPEVPPQWFPSNMCNNVPNDITGYYNWLSNNTMQTQSFMLNTLNQCYQMLWMQQREMGLLKNNVTMLQERLKHCNIGPANNYSPVPVQTNSQVSPNRRIHQSEVDRKINQDAGFAMPMPDQFDCSLPNMPLNCLNNNSQLLESCLNNINVNRLNIHHNTSESSIPAHSVPNHMWSGQALNNQVVPGNRANNYWDNFRSYSRQNLLSTKNTGVLQNLPPVIDRPNFGNQPNLVINPFAFMSFSRKSNSEQDSSSTSQENTPQRTTTKDTGLETLDSLSRGAHADILNNSMRNCDATEQPAKDVYHKDNTDMYFGLPSHPNTNGEPLLDHPSNAESRIPEEAKGHDEGDESVADVPQISKFDVMRESVYKEVASLISANENRPQFLIQLFRDLQMIKSDNGRFNILQSIERNVTQSSVSSSQNINKQVDQSRKYSVQSVPSLDLNTSSNASSNNEYSVYTSILQKMQVLLDHHEETIIQNQFARTLKQLLLGLECVKEVSKETLFHHHLESFLNRELESHYGKRLGDVKLQLLGNIECFLIEQLGLARLADEICTSANNHQPEPENVMISAQTADGDLAEADQSGIITEDILEEGAVGGVLEAVSQLKPVDTAENLESDLLPLPNQSRSRSTTPTRDQSSVDSQLLQL
ncbi:uncharacterized protein [Diabrotica undecimpunctata]|uniref:uncharacterized protein isoform X1 n=1 Tax=Diabrotica undecimpunctata TaxID=50387 RepID=UPI003B634C7C